MLCIKFWLPAMPENVTVYAHSQNSSWQLWIVLVTSHGDFRASEVDEDNKPKVNLTE